MTTPTERVDNIWRALQRHARESRSRGDACEGLVVTKQDVSVSARQLVLEVDALAAGLVKVSQELSQALLLNAAHEQDEADLKKERDRLRAAIAAEISGAERCAAGAVDSLDKPTREWFARKAERLKRALGET
jgi:hypothetical protein